MKSTEANDLMQRMKLAKSAHIPLNTQDKIVIVIPGVPIPKQSVRSYDTGKRFINKKGKSTTVIGHHQTNELDYAKKKIKADIAVQLPKGFIPWKGPVQVNRLAFVYKYLKSHKKAEREQYKTTGIPLPKWTRPDQVDNLKKLLFDCMSEMVYEDDAQICYEKEIRRYYADESFTMIELQPLQL